MKEVKLFHSLFLQAVESQIAPGDFTSPEWLQEHYDRVGRLIDKQPQETRAKTYDCIVGYADAAQLYGFILGVKFAVDLAKEMSE